MEEPGFEPKVQTQTQRLEDRYSIIYTMLVSFNYEILILLSNFRMNLILTKEVTPHTKEVIVTEEPPRIHL